MVTNSHLTFMLQYVGQHEGNVGILRSARAAARFGGFCHRRGVAHVMARTAS